MEELLEPKKKISEKNAARFDQARLLLTRLNDEDIDCPMARRHLNIESEYILINCINFFQAYFYIILKAKVLSERGYELSEYWELAAISVSDHLGDYCLSELSGEESSKFDYHIRKCFTVALDFHRRSLSLEV